MDSADNSMDQDLKTSRSVCDQCGKRFSNVYTLSAHKKQVHDGIKSFACNICENRFATKHKLQRHFLGVHSDKRDFHCDTCGNSFKTRDMLVKHQRTHFDKGPFSCVFCDEVFKFKSGLDHHTKLKHLEKETSSKDSKPKVTEFYECPICNKLLKSLKQLQRHEASSHQMYEAVACSKCSMTFDDLAELELHEKTHQEESFYSCSYCHKLYKSKHNFAIHLSSHENSDDMKDYEFVIDPIIEEIYEEEDSNEENPINEYKHVAIMRIETKKQVKANEEVIEMKQETNLEINSLESLDTNDYSEIIEDEVEDYLIDHDDGMDFYETIIAEEFEPSVENSNENEDVFVLQDDNIDLDTNDQLKSKRTKSSNKSVCDECGATFKNTSHMRRHVQRKHRRESYKFECEICGSRFLLNFDLKRHMIKHSNVRNYHCDLCGQKFKTELSLKNHHKILHNPQKTQEKKFVCNFCDRSYLHQRHLDYHKRKHTGDQRYSCDSCDKLFFYSDAVKWHKIRFHCEAAPFNCSDCGKKFIHEKSFRSHEKDHEAGSGSLAVDCKICGKSVSEKRHLLRHMRGHTEKRFHCKCGEAFKERHQLSKHSLTCKT